MEKETKKILLTAILSLAIVLSINTGATAKAKVSLSATKKTLEVGKTFTLKLKNNKSKVKWSVSNASVKIIKSSKKQAKIKAMKKGTATVKAKVGKKTYKCKVKVIYKKLDQKQPVTDDVPTTEENKENTSASVTTEDTTETVTEEQGTQVFSKEEALKNITCDLNDTGNGVVAILKNNNDFNVAVDANLVYYYQKQMVGTKYNFNYCIEKGRECVLFFERAYDNTTYKYKDYDDFKVVLSVDKSKHDGYSGEISTKFDLSTDGAILEIRNTSDKTLEFINVSCVFYDNENKIIGESSHYADCKNPGSISYQTFGYPKSKSGDTLIPSSCLVYVNHAY